jgi:protein-tyrosine phosphatase
VKARVKKILKRIKANTREVYWGIYGNTIQNPRLPVEPGSFLFVCKGNICRSPFAEHVALRMANKRNITGKTFYSVGLDVTQSLPSPEDAVLAALRFHVDLHAHRSRQMTDDMLESFDMILVMEASQFNFLRRYYPRKRNKIFLLPLFGNNSMLRHGGYFRYNILDPYGKPVDDFLSCYERIYDCLSSLLFEMQAAELSVRGNSYCTKVEKF